jgi:hypothetical protein
MTEATIQLSSGQTFTLIYSWTFGEAAIFCALLVLIVIICVKWLRDMTLDLWRTSREPWMTAMARMAQALQGRK